MALRPIAFFLLFFLLGPMICYATDEESLTWQDCLREAARNHPDLISARENVQQSRNNKSIKVSGLLPQVTSSVSLSTAQSDQSGTNKSSSATLSGSQLLFDGFKTIQQTKSASEDVKAAGEGFRFISSQVRLRLRVAFIDLLKAQSLVKISEDIYKIRRDNLQLINLRYESGMEHRGALLTAQANLASAEFERHQAEKAVEVAQWELSKELGREQFSTMKAKEDLSVMQDREKDPDFKMLAAQHPSALKILAQKNSASYDVKSSQGDFYPTVSLDGDLSRTGSGWPPRDNGSGVALKVSLPVFEGGLRMAQLSTSKSIYRQLQANERSTKDGIMLTLQQSWRDLDNAIENIAVQEKFLAAAEERARIAEAQYSVGLVSFDNWTIIEDTLVRQKKTFLDAEANAQLAMASWIEAKGETLEYEK